jgi:abortive infection bacteriophage resistance protein
MRSIPTSDFSTLYYVEKQEELGARTNRYTSHEQRLGDSGVGSMGYSPRQLIEFLAGRDFGTISVAYMNLAHPKFGSVCGSYGLPHPVLISWLHSLNYIRNICAHHARLWNRDCRIKPLIARAYKSDLTPNERVYAQLVVMQILLARIAPGNHWALKLRDLLAEHPAIPLISMGFPADWASRKVWGLGT